MMSYDQYFLVSFEVELIICLYCVTEACTPIEYIINEGVAYIIPTLLEYVIGVHHQF